MTEVVQNREVLHLHQNREAVEEDLSAITVKNTGTYKEIALRSHSLALGLIMRVPSSRTDRFKSIRRRESTASTKQMLCVMRTVVIPNLKILV